MGEENDSSFFAADSSLDRAPEESPGSSISRLRIGDSRFDRGAIQLPGTRLVRLPDPLRAAHDRLVAKNPPNFFREFFRKSLPTSIDELEWGSPILTGLADLSHSPAQKIHSIIAVRPDSPADHCTDGLART